MSKNNGASDGVAELLRQVSERNKKVDEMAKRAQEDDDDDDDVDSNNAKPSPIDMIKKKFTEINVGNSSTNSTKSPTKNGDDYGDIKSSSATPKTVKPSPIDMIKKKFTEINVNNSNKNLTKNDEDDGDVNSSSATPKTNEWGKEILQKISSVKESIQTKNQLLSSSFQKSSTSGDEEERDRRPEFLKKFAEQSSKSGRDMLLWGTDSSSQKSTTITKEGGDDDQDRPRQRPEFLKNLEQSSKSGRDMLINFSKKISIQKPLMGESTASIAERTAQSQYRTEEEIVFPATIVALPPPETETVTFTSSSLSETKREDEFTIGDEDEEEKTETAASSSLSETKIEDEFTIGDEDEDEEENGI